MYNPGQGSSEDVIALSDVPRKVVAPSTSRVTEKWLNVILDLNGVLYVCEDKRSLAKVGRNDEIPPGIEIQFIGLLSDRIV